MISKDKYFEEIAQHKLLAKHEVGQNFLIDPEAAERIVSLGEFGETDNVLEIGSGAGSLSYFIASSSIKNADLIDIDEGLVTKLQNDFADVDNINVKQANALKTDMGEYTKIIGNLPYYITSSLIERCLLEGINAKKMVFMVQKEALNRLLSPVGSKDYGPLTILLNYRSTPKREFTVNRNAFAPAPHIDSSVFSLEIIQREKEKTKRFYRMLCSLFLHRRKTILNNLQSYLKDPDKSKASLLEAGIPFEARPESLALEKYLKLYEIIEK